MNHSTEPYYTGIDIGTSNKKLFSKHLQKEVFKNKNYYWEIGTLYCIMSLAPGFSNSIVETLKEGTCGKIVDPSDFGMS